MKRSTANIVHASALGWILSLLICSCASREGRLLGGEPTPSARAPVGTGQADRFTPPPRPADRQRERWPRLLGRTESSVLAPVVRPGGMSRKISPATQKAGAAGLADGAVFVNRSGRMIHDEKTQTWRFVPQSLADDKPALPVMEILPSSFLGEMEKIVNEQAPAEVVFHVTAEVTRYRDRGYLLIRKALWERLPAGQEAP